MLFIDSTSSLPSKLIFASYFRSGWVFLIPYLAVYLLYAWLDWPVNPNGDKHQLASSESTDTTSLPFSNPVLIEAPPLLFVYWGLHAIHAALGAVSISKLWRRRGRTKNKSGACEENRPADADFTRFPSLGFDLNQSAARYASHESVRDPTPGERLQTTLPRVMPWLCLGLLFYIPGIYLEWPSDPWEHLRRVNEWFAHSAVTDHASWKKSSYFLIYSLTGHITGLRQLSCLNFYYTGICLLLCWQYYRLARTVGLGERASMIFVVIQALLMGNNIFSFYRYYGLSTSIIAQIGAVALTRLALELLDAPNRQFIRAMPDRGRLTVQALSGAPPPPILFAFRILPVGVATLSLLSLITFNHVQGFGIAGLGVGAVIVWRLIAWRRSMIGWLAFAALILSVATALWFPRHPAVEEIYQPLNWLAPWYGFNLFDSSSPAFDRMMQIIGVLGITNLIAGLCLLRHNHVAGWLTLMPIIILSLPCIGLPLAHIIASTTYPDNIVTFHRMFFAIPVGLASVLCISGWLAAKASDTPFKLSFRLLFQVGGLAMAALGAVVLLVPPATSGKRTWHLLTSVPADLRLAPIWTAGTQYMRERSTAVEHVMTTCIPGSVLVLLAAPHPVNSGRYDRNFSTPAYDLEGIRRVLERRDLAQASDGLVIAPTAFYSPISQVDILSGHWSMTQAALAASGAAEHTEMLLRAGFHFRSTPEATFFQRDEAPASPE